MAMSCSLKDKILNHDRQVPRYTSYPTAPHFTPLEDTAIYYNWLADIHDDEPLSLYIHVPFCSQLCWYCGCNTKITQRYAPVEDYAHLMMREIEILAAKLSSKKTVQHIHFGGGSPGLLRASDFGLIMDKLRDNFTVNDTCEIAIEIDPRGVTEERVSAYARHGVNRVSLGVQDFDDTVLESVNRAQPFSLSYDAIKLFRAHGIHAINIDLLYGLPHQTLETMKSCIDKAMLLDPDRIALFGYAHVPWMKKHMRLIDEGALPDTDLRYDLATFASNELQKNGYDMIGIDHFAKPSDPLARAAKEKTLHRNFQGYTTDAMDTLLGLGVSAIGQTDKGFMQNAVDMPAYKEAILASELPAKKFYAFNGQDKVRAELIKRLMCDLSVDLKQVCEDYNLPINSFDQELDALQAYETMGFVTVDYVRKTLHISDNARPMVRIIASAFDENMSSMPTEKRHSKAI